MPKVELKKPAPPCVVPANKVPIGSFGRITFHPWDASLIGQLVVMAYGNTLVCLNNPRNTWTFPSSLEGASNMQVELLQEGAVLELTL